MAAAHQAQAALAVKGPDLVQHGDGALGATHGARGVVVIHHALADALVHQLAAQVPGVRNRLAQVVVHPLGQLAGTVVAAPDALVRLAQARSRTNCQRTWPAGIAGVNSSTGLLPNRVYWCLGWWEKYERKWPFSAMLKSAYCHL